jgi:tight adherence protein B
MSDELNYMLARMRNGEPVELVFQRFSKRSQIDEIKQFAEVLTICVTTGSNIIDIVRKTSQVLNERMEIEHDIAISIAQKKWEARLLSCMPFLIVAIMKISSSDYMEPLYHGTGRIIMFICLILLVACVYIINKMIDIKV